MRSASAERNLILASSGFTGASALQRLLRLLLLLSLQLLQLLPLRAGAGLCAECFRCSACFVFLVFPCPISPPLPLPLDSGSLRPPSPSRASSAALLTAHQILRLPLALRMLDPSFIRIHHAPFHHVMCLFDTSVSLSVRSLLSTSFSSTHSFFVILSLSLRPRAILAPPLRPLFFLRFLRLYLLLLLLPRFYLCLLLSLLLLRPPSSFAIFF